jgi:pimeloyl-ACP methyl ester carboxylesterase
VKKSYSEHDVLAGGCQTHYAEAGVGEPLLLLHSVQPGVNGVLEYRNNIDTLSQHFRVIVPDLMGFGKTSLPNYTITNVSEAYTAHILAFMDVLGLDKAHLAGNSRGGLVAVAVAAQHPERVGRIVLLANAGGGVTKEYFEKQMEAYASFRPTPDQIRTSLAASFYNPERVVPPDLFEQFCANGIVQYSRYDAVGGLPNDVPDLRPALAATKHPILYVFGANDQRWPPVHDGLDVFLNTPGAKYYITQDCGHHPQTEKPAEVNPIMTAFLLGDMDK